MEKKNLNSLNYKACIPIVKEVLKLIANDTDRREKLEKQLARNGVLTSTYSLENCNIEVYKEGFYIQFEGTRCGYSVYAKDNDGTLELMRKPRKEKLHLLYECWGKTDIDWFRF